MEFSLQEKLDFANLFYIRAVDRLESTGKSSVSNYVMPEIIFTRRRTPKEQIAFESGDSNFVDMLEPDTSGSFICSSNKVLLNDSDNGMGIIGTIGHELGHALRWQTFGSELNQGYSELDKLKNSIIYDLNVGDDCFFDNCTDPKYIEFFGHLEEIIRNDLFRGTKFEKETITSVRMFESLCRSHELFFKGQRTVADNLLNLYHPLIERAYEVLNSDVNANLFSLEEMKSFMKYALPVLNSDLYCSLVLGIPIKEEMYKKLVTLLVEPFSEKDVSFKKHLISEEFSKKYLTKKFNDFFNVYINSICAFGFVDKSYSYYLSILAINESVENLKDEWPNVFFMTPRELGREYFVKVEKRLEKMTKRTEDSFVNRLKNRFNII